MARSYKQPQKQNLLKLPVLVEDTTFYSQYFEVNELNRVLHAGKNGFLIRGTDFLRNGSAINFEIVDRFGTPIFLTPINGYSEGGSRLVSIEVFQRANRGPGHLVLVGELDQFADGRPVPVEWQGRPNVRWVVPIQIEPGNDNRTRIRLANEPIVEVRETNFNVTRVDTNVISVSDYTASLTYDYDVQKSDGYAIEMLSSSGAPDMFFDEKNVDGAFTGSIFRRKLTKLYDSGVEVPSSASILESTVTASVSLSLADVFNESIAITNDTIKFNGEDFPTTNLISGSFEYITDQLDFGNGLVRRTLEEYTSSVVYQFPSESVTATANTSSIINFRIPFVQTNTGEISKVRISAKEANDNITGFKPFAEFTPGEKNFLVQSTSIGDQSIGTFPTDPLLQENWHAGQFLVSGEFNRTDYEATSSVVYPLSVVTSSDAILEGSRVDSTSSSDSFFFGTKAPLQLFEEIEYTLRYTAVYTPTYESASTTFTTTDRGALNVYFARTGADSSSRAESAVISTIDNPYGLEVDDFVTKTSDKSLYRREVNFRVPRTGLAHLRFVSTTGFWSIGDIEITPSVEKGFNPDEIIFDVENNILVSSTNIFKIEFLNWNDEPINYNITTAPTFISGGRDSGVDGFTVNISNQSFTFPATVLGSVLSYEGGGTEIEVLNGATPLAATITSGPPEGTFSASVVSAVNITPNEPPTVNGDILVYGDPTGMPDAVDSASITYNIAATFNGVGYNFVKKQSFTKAKIGTSGSNGVIYYIKPVDGRTFKVNPNTGTATPSILQFETLLNVGPTVVETVESSSAFGLYYSGSGTAVSQSINAYTYQVEPVNITNHDALEFRSASVVIDTIDVTDITDGGDGTFPILEVEGALTFISGSDGTIQPSFPSKITGSIIRGQDTIGTVHAEVGPTPANEITGSIISSSTNVSGSFQQFVEGNKIRNVVFTLFSGSGGSAVSFDNESFYLIRDGSTGLTGSNAVNIILDPPSQVVSQSFAGNFAVPQDFTVKVVESGQELTYTVTNPPIVDGTFTINQVTSGSNTGAVVTPDIITEQGVYYVGVGVRYRASDGSGTGGSQINVSQSMATVLEGTTGPGIVFTGVWDNTRQYQYSIGTGSRRDAVLYTGSGGPEIDGYYATLQPAYVGAEPSASTDTAYWQYLGEQDFFVAAKIGIFEESFIENTLNIGENSRNGVSSANITIYGGVGFPYISIGQNGNQGYATGNGIFIGNNTGSYVISAEGADGGLFFDGTDLTISGSIQAQTGSFTGNVQVGDRVIIGPNASPNTPATFPVSFSPTATSQSISVTLNAIPPALPDSDVGNDTSHVISTGASANDQLEIKTYIGAVTGSIIDSFFTLNVVQAGFITESFALAVGNNTNYVTLGDDASATNVSVYISYDVFGYGSGTFVACGYNIVANYTQPNLVINGSGIFVDYGSGTESLLTLALATPSVVAGGGGGGGGSLQTVTDVGSTTTNALTITNATAATNQTTGALIITGGLGVGGNGYADDWIATSDLRLKNIIGRLGYGLDEVMRMNPIVYQWKDPKKGKENRLGFGAQDMMEIISEVVHGGEDTHYSISYNSIIPVLVNAIKELKNEIDDIKKNNP